MHYRFHANLYAMPEGVRPGATVGLRGVTVRMLACEGAPPTFDAFFPQSFEQVMAALAALPRIDAEPDGFFVLSGEIEGRRWQLDAHLFDFGGRLHRVELHGECPAETLDAILGALNWPATPIAFELIHEGVAVDEPAFRSIAAISLPVDA